MSEASVLMVVSRELALEFFDDGSRSRLEAAATMLSGGRAAEPLVRVDRLGAAGATDQVRALVTSWDVDRLDAAVLERFPRLELVAHVGATLKFLVSDELFARGIRVSQAGQGMARSVAEASLAFTLALLHRVHRMDHLLRDGGEWYDARATGAQHEILGATVAVVGASRTGRAYLDLVRALGAQTLVVDPTLDGAGAAALGAELVDLDEAMRRALIVAVHAPTLPETHHLIGARELALMPDGAGLVNTARSWVVDEAALLRELASGRIDAAVDVFDDEPFAEDSAFRSLPNVLVTPHRAAGTVEGRLRQGRIVADEVKRFAHGERLRFQITPEQMRLMA